MNIALLNIPTYRGLPLSAILPVCATGTLWIWGSLWNAEQVVRETSLQAVSELVSQGWIQATYNSSAILETQLYEVARLVDTQDGKEALQYWYQPEHKTGTPRPVILAFSIEASPQPQTIPMLNPLPLPQLGEYALVTADDERLVPYHILSLPLEARQRWAALGDKLKELSAPLLWPAFTERHRLASNETQYQFALISLLTQQRLTIGKKQAEIIIQGAQLQAAHKHIEELRKALSKANWLDQWREIQHMAQTLANDYYEHHQNVIASADAQADTPPASDTQAQQSLPLAADTTDQATIEEPPKKKRGRRPRVPATPLVAKGRNAVTIKSDIINREIINALRDKNTYELLPDQGIAEHKHRFYQKDKGQIIISIMPLEGESWETVLHALNTLGDGCIDTYIAAMAIAIDRNGTDHIRMPFQISPDDILEVCGKKKSNGSFTPFQRAEIIKHLKTLSQARVVATMPGRPPARNKRGKKVDDGTTLKAEGALIDLLSFKIGEYHTITGEEVWEKRSIAIGEWATMIPELSSKTATMLRQVLAYSAKNERYQKRLGVYLTFMFRINARKGGTFQCSMRALLEGAGIVPPRQQGEFREAIEHALAMLKKDNVSGDYGPIIESTPEAEKIDREVQEHAKGWFNSYLQQMWSFSPPEATRDQYKRMLKAAPTED